MLGHAKISTTQIYAKVVGKKVMKDTAPLRAIYNDDKDNTMPGILTATIQNGNEFTMSNVGLGQHTIYITCLLYTSRCV